MGTKFTKIGGSSVTVAKAATTTNITLSGAQTIDGISLSAGDICLVKNQSTASQNGVYTVAAGAWTLTGQLTDVFVTSGTANGKLRFVLQSANTYTSTVGVWA